MEGQDNVQDLYCGHVKDNKRCSGRVLRQMKNYKKRLKNGFNEEEYSKLLDLWVKGFKFDWNRLYGESKPRRISLPTYPFTKERYWIPESTAERRKADEPLGSQRRTRGVATIQHPATSIQHQASTLHPLVHTNTSSFDEQRFSSTFTGEESFLTDHVVQGQKVLPGVAYLEMARAAVEHATSTRSTSSGALSGSGQGAGLFTEDQVGIRLKNVVWARPIAVKEHAKEVHIGLFPDLSRRRSLEEDEGGRNDPIQYEIYSDPEYYREQSVAHSQGVATFSAFDKLPPLDFSGLRVTMNRGHLSSWQCYDAFRKIGIDYGSGHQGLESVYVGKNQALAKLSLPSSVLETQDHYVLHPSLMDSALQASLPLFYDNCQPTTDNRQPFLPFALEAIEITGPCTASMWAWIRTSDGGVAGDKIQKLDIDLCDEQGKLSVRVKGFSSRLRDAEAISSATLGTLMCYPVWKEEAIPKEASLPEYFQRLVMLCEMDSLVFERSSLPENTTSRAWVYLRSDGNDLAQRYQDISMQVFEAIRGILDTKPVGKILIQILIPSQGKEQLFCGLYGLLKTTHLENPKILGQVIEVDPSESEQGLLVRVNENSRCPEDGQIRYQDGKRYVKRFQECNLENDSITPALQRSNTPLKQHGVYLITGGAGGLGMIFAREIAEKTNGVTLVLTGRSGLSKEKQDQLNDLELLGARIDYRQVDVTQENVVVNDLIKRTIEGFGQINGIIHAAGVIRDNFILKKTKKELEEVLAPKVNGLVLLDQASKDVALDFFVLFSSGTGVIGNPGQADYACANAFMDAYAGYRNTLVAKQQRHGQTLSIDWPLWQDGGMRVDEATEIMLKYRSGIIPLQTPTGIKVFYQALASGADQVMVMEGNLKHLQTLLAKERFEEEASLQGTTENNFLPVRIGQETLKEKALHYFKRQLSSILKLPPHRIQAAEPLEKYGIDSIMAMQLTNQLEKSFGSLSKTLFFEYQTIQEVSDYFVKSYEEKLLEIFSVDEEREEIAGTAAIAVTEEVTAKRRPRRSRFASIREISLSTPAPSVQNIAIVGLSGRYPQAQDLQEYWANLRDGKDCITEVPGNRWDWRDYYTEDCSQTGSHYSKWGGFIEDVDKFDPLFFNISPREAKFLDPQERLFLELVWMALEDAGYCRANLVGRSNEYLSSQVGVYAGVMYGEYQLFGAEESLSGNRSCVSSSYASIANRVSFVLNLHGPSMTIDTMCSSSLTALYLACQDLKHGRTDLAIAGGVNVTIHPNKYLMLSSGQFISNRGHCESFGNGGDGYIPGEGVGVTILKRLVDAERDGDHVYGVIKGSALNHGGKTNGYSVPNPNAQQMVITRALKEAQIDPRTVSYVEAHGTGTKLGDPIEITGLTKAFEKTTKFRSSDGDKDKQYCRIGSAKSNIGHCESAAGIAGITKVLLQMQHGKIVPSLHSKTLNPHIDFTKTPFVVNQELQAWEQPVIDEKSYPRVAGVSSFGAGGANAHMIVEEYIQEGSRNVDGRSPPCDRFGSSVSPTARLRVQSSGLGKDLSDPSNRSNQPHIILLSAKNEDRLKEVAKNLHEFINQQIQNPKSKILNLNDLAYTLQVGREAMDERLALMVSSQQELEEKLKGFVEGQDDIVSLHHGQVKRNKETLTSLADDEDMAKTIDAWIVKGKFDNLLDLWIKGLNFDWNKLYGDVHPHRISLPTYPFARERYWVEKKKGTKAQKQKGTESVKCLHPLVHENTSNFGQQRFSSTFTGHEFFFADHKIQGQKILPRVVYLEMARAAVKHAAVASDNGERFRIRLKDIVWAKSIVAEEEPLTVHIGLYPEDIGEIAYEIYSEFDEANSGPGRGPGPSQRGVHSHGTVELLSSENLNFLDINRLKVECSHRSLTANQCYESFRAMGIDHGVRYQGIQEINLGNHQALAKLELPSSITDTTTQFMLHPSLMDSALQASFIVTLENSIPSKTEISLPTDLKDLQIFGRCPSFLWAWIRHVDRDSGDDNIEKLDIDLCDDRGNVLVALHGVTFSVPIGHLHKSAGFANQNSISPMGTKVVVGESLHFSEPKKPPEKSIKLSSLQSSAGVRAPIAPAYLGKRSLILLEPAEFYSNDERPAATEKVEIFDHGQGVFRIRVCDPEHKNLLTKKVISGLSENFTLIEKLKGKVILLTGDNENFLSGGVREQGECIQGGLHKKLAECEIPVIAVIKGRCIGVGWLLGALCDFMVYSEESICQHHGIEANFVPCTEERALFCRRVGQVFGREVLHSGRYYSGQDLREKASGITVIPARDVDAHVLEMASRLAKSPRESLVQLKRQLSRKRADYVNSLSDPQDGFQVEGRIDEDHEQVASMPLESTSPLLKIQSYADGVILLSIRDQQNKNHLSEILVAALEESFEKIRRLKRYKVVVVTGADSYFLTSGFPETVHDLESRLQSALSACELPVIAAMQGDANGLGWLFGLLCDEAVYSETAKYSYRSLVKGCVPSIAACRILPFRFGPYWGNELLYTGRESSGRELKEGIRGLTIVPKEEVEKRAMEIARGWALLPRPTLTKLKKTLSHDLLDRFTRQRVYESKSAKRVNDHSCEFERECQDRPCGPEKAVQLDTKIIKTVVYENGVIAVTMCDHDSNNAFTETFVRGLTEVFDHIKASPEYKAVILTGFDQYFACGGTKEGLLAIQKGKVKYSDFPIYELPIKCDIPVIAAMQGHSIGAGWNLGLFCDLLILSEESVYCSKFMEFGFTPGAGSTLMFPHWMGEDLANEILFMARIHKGAQLKGHGIPVVGRSEIPKYALKLANRMALSTRQDLVELKKNLCWDLRNQLEDIYREELVMHEKTFVDNPEVFQRIRSHFDDGVKGIEPSAVLPVEIEESNTRAVQEATLETDETMMASIRKTLRHTLAEELHMKPDLIDEETLFTDIGLDSISGVTWVKKINEKFGLELAATKVYNYPSIGELAEFVLREGKQQEIFLPSKSEIIMAKSEPIVHSPRTLSPRDKIRFLPKIGRSLVETPENPKNLEGKPTKPTGAMTESIAIIGMGGRFPKAATVAEFWNNLMTGRDCISEIPASRWPLEKYYDTDPKVPEKTSCKWMGALEDVDQFDPLFFNISPLEAQLMDPQQRLFLEICWHCIEDAGYAPYRLSGSKCGVFVGCGQGDYSRLLGDNALNAYGLMGCATSILAARISYLLNLQGPCVSIDTACSSSLVAMANACDSLMVRASDMVLAGGVCVLAGPSLHIMASKAGMLSTEGRCFTFDQRAGGFVPGEGGGVVLLKRLEEAEKDGDSIYGVIRGWGINQDGKTNGITAPNPDSQLRLEKEIYEKYRINPEDIQLIEAHGTGTKLGDPIEIEGLVKSFRLFTDKENFCALGSVKSNIGHLLTAAGIAGVIKLLLALKHQKLPPTIHFDTLNEHIQLKGTPFYVNAVCKDWVVPEGLKRQAAISSFGFSGTNAHIVIGEYIQEGSGFRIQGSGLENNDPHLIVLSAKNEVQLNKVAKNLHSYLTVNRESRSAGLPSLALREPEAVNLRDLAYTLQVGREPMEERLGLIVGSLQDLEEKLKGFLEGRDDIEGLYRGKINRDNIALSRFAADEDMSKTIDAWVTKGKYSKLLDFWANGGVLDWNKIWNDDKPRRISLPTYPFIKERYWINGISDFRFQISDLKNQLHPLVHENTSDLEEKRFSSTFSGEEFFLADHQINGQKVLPGVAFLEMARTAVGQAVGSLAEDQRGIQLKNVVWARPIIVNSSPQVVHIGLFPEEDGHIQYEIYTDLKHGEAESVVHSQGVATFRTSDRLPSLDLAGLRTTRDQWHLSSKQSYDAFKRMEIEYGAGHRGLESVYVGKNQVLAKLSLPSSVLKTQHHYVLHPSLLDSALQASIGLVIHTLESGENKHNPFLPFALGKLEIIRPCTSLMWVLVRYSDGSATGEKVQKLDIDLFDDRGNISVKMKGLSSRIFDGEVKPAEPVRTLICHPMWKEEEVPKEPNSPEFSQRLVMMCEIDPLGFKRNGLAENIPGSAWFQLQSEGKDLAKRFQDISIQVFETIRRILEKKPKGKVLIQIIIISKGDSNVFSGLSALLKTAHLENPKILGQVIEVNPSESEEGLLKKVNESSRCPGDVQIRYQDGKRHVKRFQEWFLEFHSSTPALQHSSTPFKDHGVYLITGGAGGLGLIFAKEIARIIKYFTLILVGRSHLSREKQDQLNELDHLGASIEYRRVDVGQQKAVENLIQSIVTDFGQINGIIHSAGVIHDNFILKKSVKEFQGVLAPKVAGTVFLDQATRNLDLDFFVLFSSGTGVMGNPGQADYACANAFMDAYAHYRNGLLASKERQGQALSINWPLWREGGMRVDEATEKTLWKKTGMIAMRTSAGVQAFYQSLASTQGQMMVVEGEAERLRTAVLKQQSTTEVSQKSFTQGDRRSISSKPDDVFQEKVTNYFIKLLASTLKLSVARIQAREPLEKYGIDSIMAMELTNQLEKIFGSLSKTLFFEYRTIHEVSDYFIKSYGDKLRKILSVDETSEGVESAAPGAAVPEEMHSKRQPRCSRFTSIRETSFPTPTSSVLDIAIIGLSGRYPQACDLEEYWKNLRAGKDCISEVPEDRWDWREYYSEDRNQLGAHYSKWGGFIEDVDKFDPLFFNISPREAEFMDPQERLFLETVWKTLEDGGYCRSDLVREPCEYLPPQVGVYAGVMYSEYQLLGAEASLLGNRICAGNSYASIANRVSYALNLHGPSMTVDTMCSSSLTALHLACQDLKHGRTDLAIAGGVNVTIHPNKYLMLSGGQFISNRGHCESFGVGGDGYIPGEGVGAVLLKRLSDAKQNGDHIYGVIKGSAVNHGGKTNGYSVPSPNAQQMAISRALKEAQIDPRTISYIEAHGTGTKLGDPIEITGLKKAFEKTTKDRPSDGTLDQHYCKIGSAKSNIGHCESAAGIAGLTKVLLQMQNGQIVPSLHSQVLNPYIDFTETPFSVNQKLRNWDRPVVDGKIAPRTAGISSFGAGGSNAHVIIEEYVQKGSGLENKGPYLIVISAKNEDRLKEVAKNLFTYLTVNRESHSAELPSLALREPETVNLGDLAYTLQVGREAMEERLAMIVQSARELEGKLKNFMDGQSNIENLYPGQVKRNKDALSVFVADEEFQETIGKWIQRGKFSKVLDLWVKGLAFDWNKLYGDSKPRRISLPTYPFTKERYWVEVEEGISHAGAQGQKSAKGVKLLHPLVHENTSNVSELRFTSRFVGDEFFLKDHQVKGEKVLPGVAYLEMAQEAVKQATGELSKDKKNQRIQLKNVVVGGMPPDVNALQEIHVRLFPKEDGEIAYEIYTNSPNVEDRFLIHSNGIATLVYSKKTPSLNLADLQAKLNQNNLCYQACYEAVNTMRIDYGLAHQGLEKIYFGDKEVLAKLTLPAFVSEAKDQFTLHPGLLDSALQASIGLVLKSKTDSSLSAYSLQPTAFPSLPFALDHLEIIDRCPESMWAWVRLVPQFGSDGSTTTNIQKLDIDLCDDEGKVCVKILGFSSRVLGGDISERSEAIGTLVVKPVWKEKSLDPNQQIVEYTKHRVFLCGLRQKSQRLQDKVCHISFTDLESDQNTLEQCFEAYSVQLFESVQKILQEKSTGPVLIQALVPDEGPQQVYFGLSGLLKTACLENPKILGQVIAVHEEEKLEDLIAKLHANSQSPIDQQIRYEGEKRFVGSFEESTNFEAGKELPWKNGGVYLITGGAGGLGHIFAKEIAETVQNATLILAGRSKLSDAKKAILQELQSSGVTIDYKSVDVCNKEAVEILVHEIQTNFGGLNGIIHSAGVIRDSFIIKKTVKEFQEVLAPKVAGTVFLDQATEDLTLDFFVLFSSLAGSLGNLGQADYACANAFMDSYSRYRNHLVATNHRQGQTLSINWPLWKDGGMQIDEATKTMMRQSMGMVAMRTSSGIRSFFQGLSSNQSQVIVLEGDLLRIKERFLNGKSKVELPSAKTSILPIDKNALKEKTLHQLKRLFGEIIKLSVDRIESHEPLENYGIDSIMITQLNQTLEGIFGEISKTLFFEYQTLAALADYFVVECPEECMAWTGFKSSGASRSELSSSAIQLDREFSVLSSVKSRNGRKGRFFVRAPKTRVQEPIAIIGMSGRYPQAKNLTEYWENLKEGKVCISEIPKDRWSLEGFFESNPKKAVAQGKSYCKWGGFVEDFAEFDPFFFNISPREANSMDPQERMFIMECWWALEDAGYRSFPNGCGITKTDRRFWRDYEIRSQHFVGLIGKSCVLFYGFWRA